MLKRAAKEKEKAGTPMATDKDLERASPILLEFLTRTQWEDGAVRKVGTLMLVAEGGKWKAWLHDADGKRSAWVSGDTIQELVMAIDVGLLQDRLNWRADKK